ncbi:MAG: glycosyltransferase family 1 protein [bacterium]|nr:glycosyltransferase family 1 protein [bacterium]
MSIKIAIDISPLKNDHATRGIGFYTKNLVESLGQTSEVKGKEVEIDLVESTKGLTKKHDLVHYPYFDLFYPTLPLKKSAKTVVTIHDVVPLIFPKHYPPGLKGKIKLAIQKLSLSGVSAVITDSKVSKEDIIKYLSFPKDKIHVVYLAAGNEFRKIEEGKWKWEIQEKYNLPEKFVLYVGDVNWNKNVSGLAEACKRIEMPLVIVGKQAVEKYFDEFHPETQPLVQLIKLFGNDPNILRLGFIPDEDLVKIYNLATVYCQPSFYEGFGLPVLQAMSCGCPVVSSQTGSLQEIAGEAAIFVDPYKVEQIAGGLEKMTDEKTRKEFVDEGFKQVKKYTWEKTAKEVIDVYKKVLEAS